MNEQTEYDCISLKRIVEMNLRMMLMRLQQQHPARTKAERER